MLEIAFSLSLVKSEGRVMNDDHDDANDIDDDNEYEDDDEGDNGALPSSWWSGSNSLKISLKPTSGWAP